MPRSTRTRLAKQRSARSRENYSTARFSVGCRNNIGLDDCTPAQLALRYLLAAFIFDTAPVGTGGHSLSPSTLTCYSITPSARFDELVLVTDAPDNVTGYLVPTDPEFIGIPGLRIVHIEQSDYHMLHLPSGALMRVTRRSTVKGRKLPPQGLRDTERGWWTPQHPLSAAEEQAMAAHRLPSLDAQTLLAALITRWNFRDPHQTWAASWFYDPFDRPGDHQHRAWGGPYRRLKGAGDDWHLEWNQCPAHPDIAAMLTDPIVGLSDTIATVHNSHHIELSYKSAKLSLYRKPIHGRI
ncbi:hypothetical protein [Phytomonospora endophytica]|uniref:Uncharacterized protein n=1 Tax=Phytomonospora endophytica TaxID=714109 RepID=A0A841FTS8_9ACTN|nr:hypothetical protein [Phytomonospora endophytica]MBB6038193.1 hypothetical protein [Phytomonospora endophytica]GIG67347.1 hypothetical protein Pen01_36420 [Phytomonospora endophytica]